MKKILTGFFVIIVAVTALGLQSGKAGATFNSNNLIDDVIFDNVNSMSAAQIDSWLNANFPSSCISTNKGFSSPDPIGYSPSTGFIYGGNVSAGKVIYDAGQAYGINPQVILATLQKESSVVSGTASYGCQYINTAMGYDCPDSGGCPRHPDTESGFSKQIIWASWLFKRGEQRSEGNSTWAVIKPGWDNSDEAICYSGPMTQGYRKRCGTDASPTYYDGYLTVDGVSTHVDSGATAALYWYTPHFHGNQLFVNNFESWFGSTKSNTPVYQGASSGRLYLVSGGAKYYIPTIDIMIAWGLEHYSVDTLPESYLDSLPTGDDLSNIAKMSDNPSSPLFMLDDGKRYPVSITDCAKDPDNNPIANTTWGLDCFNSAVSKAYPSAVLQKYTAQDIALPQMIAYNNSVWKLENGKKRRIVDALIIDVLGGWGNIRWMKDLNAQQPIGKMLMRNGYVVRFSDSPVVYLYDNGQLYTVPSPTDMVNWGLDRQPLHDFPASYNSDPLPTGPSLTQVASDGSSIFLVDKGYKMPFGSVTTQWPTGSPTVTPGQLGNLTSIPLSNVYLADSGEIFTVYGSKRYIFPTMDDFFKLGFNGNTIRSVSTSVENLPGITYGGMHMANGRLYKVNNNVNQIYMVSGSNSLYVNSINYPGLPYDKLITVDPTTAARYPVAGTYTP